MTDYLGNRIQIGDELVIGTRNGSSLSMYRCTVTGFEQEEYVHRTIYKIVVKLESNGRRQVLDEYIVNHRAIIVNGSHKVVKNTTE